MRITEEMRQAFESNFDPDQFADIRDGLRERLAGFKTIKEAHDALDGFDMDDDGESFYVSVELDRSRMATESDCVEADFLIAENDSGLYIDLARIYAYEGDMLCSFDPDTYEITEWL